MVCKHSIQEKFLFSLVPSLGLELKVMRPLELILEFLNYTRTSRLAFFKFRILIFWLTTLQQ